MRKYNEFLVGMIGNYRRLAKEHNLRTDHMTNEQVYSILEHCGIAPSGDEQGEWFIEELKKRQP